MRLIKTLRRAIHSQNGVTTFVGALGMTVLVILGVIYLLQERWLLLLQVGLSLVILAIYMATSRKLHQDAISSFFVVLTGILHNLGLYGTHPLGIRFDHYTHFLGGFAVAIIIDRFYQEKLTRVKRFFLLIMSALGVGALLEIVQWADGYFLPTIKVFQADSMSNSMNDMIFDVLVTGHVNVIVQLDFSLIPFGILVVSLRQR